MKKTYILFGLLFLILVCETFQLYSLSTKFASLEVQSIRIEYKIDLLSSRARELVNKLNTCGLCKQDKDFSQPNKNPSYFNAPPFLPEKDKP